MDHSVSAVAMGIIGPTPHCLIEWSRMGGGARPHGARGALLVGKLTESNFRVRARLSCKPWAGGGGHLGPTHPEASLAPQPTVWSRGRRWGVAVDCTPLSPREGVHRVFLGGGFVWAVSGTSL